MRVNIDEIKEGGLERAGDLSREIVDQMVGGDQAGYRARGPAHVDFTLRKSGRRVLLRGKGQADLAVECGRCLVPLTRAVPLDFELVFVPKDDGRRAAGPRDEVEEDGGSVEARLAEEETYAGKEIELDNAVREQLILALPPYPVCSEDCKGLCAVCGTNLNERECGCDRKIPDPRWAGLDKFRK
jgi:DUF177 domain-containing protein